MKFMLLMSTSANNWEAFGTMTPEEIQAHIRFMKDLNRELAASGELIDAQGLTLPNEARIVRGGKDGGAPVVSDGPFPETKEFLAGYWLLECRDQQRAVEIAARISTAPGRKGAPMFIPVELRPVGQAPNG